MPISHSPIGLVLLFSFLVPLASAQAQPTAKAKGHLFILSGQSNMTGGLEKGFSDTVGKALGEDRLTIVRSMRSGRGIRYWVEDYALPEDHELHGMLQTGNGEEYPRLLQAVKQAGDVHAFETVTFIWMQGESDAGRHLGVAYERSFKALLSRLEKDLGIRRMHFVIGRISDHGLSGDKAEGWKEVRAVQQKLAEDDPLGSWIDTDDLNGGDAKTPEGDLHYPPQESMRLGERFGEAALKQLQVNAAPTAAQIDAEFDALVTGLLRKLSDTRIWCIGVKPSPARWSFIDRQREVNALLTSRCENDPARMLFLDVEPIMLTRDGNPDETLFAKDKLHLSPAGYARWNKLLRDALAERNPLAGAGP